MKYGSKHKIYKYFIDQCSIKLYDYQLINFNQFTTAFLYYISHTVH